MHVIPKYEYEYMEKIHYLYKIIRLSDGKYYIGVHSTKDLNDGYMGSGLRIKASLSKYGKDAHSKQILQIFDTQQEAFVRESQIVNDEMLADPQCLNICLGGYGGWKNNKNGRSESFLQKQRAVQRGQNRSPEFRAKQKEIQNSPEIKAKKSDGIRRALASPEERIRISLRAKESWKKRKTTDG